MRLKVLMFAAAISGLASVNVFSQNPVPTECRSNAGPDFEEYQRSFDQDAYKEAMRNYLKKDQRAAVVQYAVQIHIVRNDAGTGGADINGIRDEFENFINPYYADIDIEFVECAPELYHNSTEYNILGDGDGVNEDPDVAGDAMASTYNVADVINIYYVTDPDSACGWARFPWKLPADYIVIANGCATNQSTTAHELGHYFGLLHTHETANGEESVTRDDTDGCWNCETAGDLLCDTPADPNISDKANNWPSCLYTGTGTDDCNDQAYNPMIDNIMSYADKECRTIFTSEQQARMEFYRDGDRSYLQTGCPCEKPVANCQDITINLSDGGTAGITPASVDNNSTWDCGLDTWSVSPNQFGCGDVGGNIVTLTIVDDLGWVSTCDATVTVEDVTDPVIGVNASNMTVECDGSGNVAAFNNWLNNNGGASASDACGGSWSNNSSGLSNGCGATGSETVTFTYTDPTGNSASTMATFTIEDNSNPLVTCPSDIHLPECVPTATWIVIASDVCGGVNVVSNPPSGSFFAKGTTTTVEVTVTDDCGNMSMCTFDVTRDPDLMVDIDPLDTSPLPTCAVGGGANIVLGYGGGPTCVTLNAVGSGGHGPYMYTWEGPPGLPGGSFTDVNTATPTFCPDFQTDPCVTYFLKVTVTDVHGCEETNGIEVNVINPLCNEGIGPKVNVCHVPEEDPLNLHTICVSPKAVPNHLNLHGDCLGSCEDVCVMFEAEMAFAKGYDDVSALSPYDLKVQPNPFVDQTEIRFTSQESANARLTILDITGQVIAIVHDGPIEADVPYSFTFDSSNLPAGVYIARMIGDSGENTTAKMLLAR